MSIFLIAYNLLFRSHKTLELLGVPFAVATAFFGGGWHWWLQNVSANGVAFLALLLLAVATWIVYLRVKVPLWIAESERQVREIAVTLPVAQPAGDVVALAESKFSIFSGASVVDMQNNADFIRQFKDENQQTLIRANMTTAAVSEVESHCNDQQVELRVSLIYATKFDNGKCAILWSFVNYREASQNVVRDKWWQKLFDATIGTPRNNLIPLKERVESAEFKNHLRALCIESAIENATVTDFPIRVRYAQQNRLRLKQ